MARILAYCLVPMKLILVLLFIFANQSQSNAATRIAFLETYDAQGELIQYEVGGRFGHSAIEIEGQWLQSYPGEGVRLISLQELKYRGTIAKIISVPQEIRKQDVEKYLGVPFDYWYSWSDESLYCSELLAKVLGIPPEPMSFNHLVWPRNYWELEGLPGISPDKIYKKLSGQDPWNL